MAASAPGHGVSALFLANARQKVQSNISADPQSDDDVVSIGVYTKAERKRKILRFREKRDRRDFTKKVVHTIIPHQL
jgi:hypothetical protein